MLIRHLVIPRLALRVLRDADVKEGKLAETLYEWISGLTTQIKDEAWGVSRDLYDSVGSRKDQARKALVIREGDGWIETVSDADAIAWVNTRANHRSLKLSDADYALVVGCLSEDGVANMDEVIGEPRTVIEWPAPKVTNA